MAIQSLKNLKVREANYRPWMSRSVAVWAIGCDDDAQLPAGDIGFEWEVEGANLPKTSCGGLVKLEHDGSLRGESLEYVFKSPLSYDSTVKVIDMLCTAFEAPNTTIHNSNRTSIHVHLNARGLSFNQFASFATLWFIYEDFFVRWCGDDRVGNHFCLTGSTSNYIIENIVRCLTSGSNNILSNNNRYAAFNTASLAKYGSIEIRSMRGYASRQDVQRWVRVVYGLYLAAKSIRNPQDICVGFSGMGPLNYLRVLIGSEDVDAMVAQSDLSAEEVETFCYNGLRNCQEIPYAIDWKP